jgi:hypothetical protein
MIPRGAQAIGNLIARIGQDLVPKAPDAYTATDLAYFTALLGMVAQDYDRAADVLTSEHAALAPILREAADRLGDAALAAEVEAALGDQPAGLRVSALSARSDVTMRLLIEVHAAVEAARDGGADWARRLDGEIWRFLETHVAAQAYDVPF